MSLIDENNTNSLKLYGEGGMSISGNYLYLTAGYEKTLTIIDISNRTSPQQVGYLSFSSVSDADVVVSGNYAYVLNTDDDFTVVDVSTKSNPVKKGVLNDTAGRALDSPSSVFVVGAHAYVTDAYSSQGGLEIINISDPNNPQHAGVLFDSAVTALDRASGIFVSGGYAYITSDEGVEIVNVTNPTSPFHTSKFTETTLPWGGWNYYSGIVVKGDYVYYVAEDRVGTYGNEGLFVLDVSNIGTPELVAKITDNNDDVQPAADDLSWPWGVALSGSYVYVTSSFTDAVMSIRVVGTPIYRFYSSNNKSHFYTKSIAERDSIVAKYSEKEWRYEGIAWYAYSSARPGTAPIHRFYSSNNKSHFYTQSAAEKDSIVAKYSEKEWRYEGIAYYAHVNATTGTLPIYRFYSQNNRAHFYTKSA